MFEGSNVVLPDAFAVEPSTVGTVILYECSLDILGFPVLDSSLALIA